MFKNYLKTSFRSLLKNRLNTFVQVLGLALGIMACLLLLDFIGYQLSFDKFHEDSDRIYRLVNDRYQDGKRVQLGTITYPAVGPAMAKDFPEIGESTRLIANGNTILRYQEEMSRVSSPFFVDEHFLEIFSFRMLAAAHDSLLRAPYEAVIPRSLADQLFPDLEEEYEKALGRTFQFDDWERELRVVGVMEDIPPNSTLQFGMLGSFETLVQELGTFVSDSWTWSDFYHFFLLEPGTDVEALESKFNAFSERYFKGQEVSGSEEKFYLQPLDEAHLYSTELEYEIGQTANGRVIWALLIVAFLILLIAWMNYVNLATVRAIERAREVGVRKIAGARRIQISGQFITEALLVHGAGFILAYQLAQLVRPHFSAALGMEPAEISLFQYAGVQPGLLLFAALLFLFGIALSGLYPAWLLSGQHLSEVLKGTFSGGKRSRGFRRGLIVIQFAASIALVAGTMLVHNQISYLNHRELGLQVDQVISISPPELSGWDSTFIDRMNSFKEALKRHPSIQSATTSSRLPGQGMSRIFGVERTDIDDGRTFMVNNLDVDHSYAETYGLDLLAGRFFRRGDHHTDPDRVSNIVANQSAIDMMGIPSPEEALGVRVRFADKDWTIVGVVPDFHQRSLHHAIEPVFFLPFYHVGYPVSIRIEGEGVEASISLIQSEFEAFFPGNIFEYRFVDEYFAMQYEADRKFGAVLFYFTLLAILIACMGLFALASYAALLRRREVSIRKVLGASVSQLVMLLSHDFIRLVVWATLIGLPMAWYGASLWMREFAYSSGVAWWVFPLTALIAILISFLTVSYRAFGVARSNPADSLKSE